MDFLTLFISLRCTQTCAHCIYGCSPDHGEHMSWDVFMQSISVAENSRIPTLNFFGGEPLLNPQIFPMLRTALEGGFSLVLATNCRVLAKEEFCARFLDITNRYKEHIIVITARDKFHLKIFDPEAVVKRLRSESYEVAVQDYSNQAVALSEYNASNEALQKLNTSWSCCKASWTDYLGVLPDGGWTICPPSLESFGNIFSNSLQDIIDFKRRLPLRYDQGCTECIKDFKAFRKYFEASIIPNTPRIVEPYKQERRIEPT